jgi:hypothetical protein
MMFGGDYPPRQARLHRRFAAPPAGAVIDQHGLTGFEANSQTSQVPLWSFDACGITNALGLTSAPDDGKLHEAESPTAMPEAPFRMFDVAPGQFIQVTMGAAPADAGSGPRDMLKTHGDMEPVGHGSHGTQYGGSTPKSSEVMIQRV